VRLLGSIQQVQILKLLIDAVTYNYMESTPQRPIWTTGSLNRTTWQDSAVFGLPHATYYEPLELHMT
jgi:ABC-type Fe3+-siderophore transport system permease subunit